MSAVAYLNHRWRQDMAGLLHYMLHVDVITFVHKLKFMLTDFIFVNKRDIWDVSMHYLRQVNGLATQENKFAEFILHLKTLDRV